MALVCNVAWAAVLPTEPIKASQNLPTMGIPEYQFYVRGTKSDGQYWNSSTVNTNDVNSAGKFAFYAVPGLADCYYIYSVTAGKWVNYNKTNRNNQKSFVEVADNFDANAYWKITMATKKSDNTSCYQMQPTVYTTKQSGVLNIQTSRYANWYQGADGSSTLGLWEQSPSVDEGSAWSLVAVDVAEDLNAQLARRIALANKVIALEATYAKGQGLLTSENVTNIISSPYTSTQEGSIAKLVDGSAGVTNHWHSDYSAGGKINGSHYIVANLGEQTPENLSFMYKRRNGAADDQTTRWAVYGVPADETGVSQDSRNGLTLLAVISTPLTNVNDVFDNLPPFKTKGFKKFRIYADATNQNRGYFHIGEFQLYGNTLADGNTDAMKELAAALATAEGVENATQNDIDALNEKLSAFIASEESIAAAREALNCQGLGYPKENNAQRLALQEILNNDDVFESVLDAAVTAYKTSADIVLPEYGKAYKMAFKTKEGALHHIVADDVTLALSASTEANDASVFYCMESDSDEYPYIFVSAQGGFLTFKALSDAYISRVTDFKVAPMVDVANNVNSTVDARLGTVYIATNKRPNSDKEDDGCFVFKNQDNTYDGATLPFHNDNFTSAIVMTEVAAESKTVYNIAVEGNDDAKANAYVAYDNGNVVRRAFNEGFFVTNGTITQAQLKAGFVGNVVKSATITVEGNAITLSDVVTFPTPVKQDLYNTSNGSLEVPPHRIPGITVDPETGRIITTAARLVCGTDPGYGQVDVVCRISEDNGEHWTDTVTVARGTGITSPEENFFDTAFGDPAVVADRTSDEVLIIVVAGCTKYQTATRQIPNEIGTIHSLDNGNTWGEPVRVTEQIYSLFDAVNGGNTIQSAFVGGGKIFQSRIVKVGKYYRLYAAMCARPNGNRVIYSDDFGRTWHALGGPAALPAPGGDEPKCEEMPDGRVILSSRVGGGRIYNIYTYSNTETAEGSWGTSVTSTFEGSGKTPGGNSTNGEILIVPVKRNSDQKEMYLALQSLPTGGGRSHVGIFYKELTDMTDINSVANFAIDWNGFFLVTDQTSAYSSMDLQNDGRIGFIYEENYTKHGEVSNPHSIPFPDANNLGTHNYDGYDNIYVAYPLEIITNNAYSIKRSVNRRTYVSNYFTALTEDASDEMKEKMTTALNALSAEPTIAEVDKLNLIAAVAQEAEGTWYCFRFEETRTTGGNVVPVGSWGYIGDNLKATATPAKNGSYFWQKIDAGDGKYHLKSMNGKYLVPASSLTTSTEQPAAAWSFAESATTGRDVIFNGDIPCQIHVYKNGTLTNWGWNSSGSGARKDDDGCKFVFVKAAKMSDVLDNLYEFDTEDLGKVGYYADATIATYKSAVWNAMLPEQIATAKAVVTSSTVWNMPVSGKAYTFKNVQKDGPEYWFTYNATDNRIDLTTKVDEATPFVCRRLNNGKYVFVCNDGKYMICRGNYSTGIKDYYDAAADAYTDIRIKKMTTGDNISGDQTATRYITVWGRRDADNEGCVVVQNNKSFNATGYKYSNPADSVKAPYYNGSYSSAFIMEEVAYANTPKLNGVNGSLLMSEDLRDKYMGTFSAPFPTVVPEGVTAYYGTEGADGAIELVSIADDEAIPANQGVILVGDEAAYLVMKPAAAETQATIKSNALAHSAGAAIANLNGYVLAAKDGVAGFYKAAAGSSLAMNKAYIASPQQTGANAPTMRIRLAGAQGGTTEVEMPIANGQQPTAIYDLQGRRVANPTKGMYIVNGKKMVIK